jgi:chaperonin GroEL
MGPGGMLVAICQDGKTKFTKDGITVMKAIKGLTKFEHVIADAIKDACNKTNSDVGDGTTSTVCLVNAIMQKSMQKITTSTSSKNIIQGLNIANTLINKFLQKLLIKPSDKTLSQVATIAVNNDKELGKIISSAIDKVDPKYGLITVEEGRGMTTELSIANGMKINSGYSSSYFAMKTGKLEFENVSILLINGDLNNQDFMAKFLNELSLSSKQGIVICNKIDNQVLRLALYNLYQNVVSGIAVVLNTGNDQDRLDLLKDIAVITGSQIINSDIDETVNEFNSVVLGSCRSAKITSEHTILFHDSTNNKRITEHVSQELNEIKIKLKDLNRNDEQYTSLQSRYTRLSGKAAIISVGAATESEISEIKDRIYDAVSSVKSATNGVCCGGGLTLYRLHFMLQDEVSKLSSEIQDGAKIVIDALTAPIIQIIKNCGKNDYSILHKITQASDINMGYDALEDKIVNLISVGIVDSYQVVYRSINNAISICKLLINTSDMIITNDNDKY